MHALLRDLLPGGVARRLSAERAARVLRSVRPKGASARLRRRLASKVLRDVRSLDRKIADLDGRIEADIEGSGTTLTQLIAIGPILAARIIGTVGDVARFPTKTHFASYLGTAPLEASSDDVVRHTLSLALETASSTTLSIWSPQARPGRTLRAGPTTARRWRRASPAKEALRCLKRRVSDAVFRSLLADSQAASRGAA